MSSLLKDDPSSRIMYDKIKVDTELNYEKLAEDSFKAELDETVKLESDKILSSVKSEESLMYSSTSRVVVVTGAGPSSSSSSSSSSVVVSSSPCSTSSVNVVHKSSTSQNAAAATTASIMSQHGNKRLFKCGFCSSTFADTYKLERHVKSEHRDITDRAKYETFPWQEPGGSSKSSHRASRQNNGPKTLFVDPSQTFNVGGHKQQQPNIMSKLKIEPTPPPPPPPSQTLALASTSDIQQNVVSSEYFLCQVCSKIFVSYKDFTYHMNESPACKNGGTDDDAFTSNDVLVILSPEDSLKFAGETILDTVVEAAAPPNEVMTHQATPTAVYECHLCRALFASADYLKKHLEICQTSNPKRRKT